MRRPAAFCRARPAGRAPKAFRAYLRTIARAGEHGRVFAYRTVNTDALAWVIEAVSGQPLAPLLSQRLWQPLGAEHDARLSIDSQGVAFAGGGLNTTLRDLARLGELLRLDGMRDGQRIVPAAAVQRLQHGAEPPVRVRRIDAPMAGWRYRSMWWATHNPHRAFMARGVHGQALYIDPAAEMVIARYASHPLPPNLMSDPTSLPAWHALAEHLIADPA